MTEYQVAWDCLWMSVQWRDAEAAWELPLADSITGPTPPLRGAILLRRSGHPDALCLLPVSRSPVWAKCQAQPCLLPCWGPVAPGEHPTGPLLRGTRTANILGLGGVVYCCFLLDYPFLYNQFNELSVIELKFFLNSKYIYKTYHLSLCFILCH